MTFFSRLTTYSVLVTVLITFCCAKVQAQSVLIYGDSISAGYGMTLPESWPYLLNEQYKAEQSGIQILNESISGETTGGGLSRIEQVLTRHDLGKNDWIIIELGGNDGLRGFPPATVKANLEAMIKAAKSKLVNVAIMQIRIPPNYGKRYSLALERIYPELADQYQLPLLPFFMEQIAVHPEYMQDDRLHPNQSAQIVIRDIMKQHVDVLLKATSNK